MPHAKRCYDCKRAKVSIDPLGRGRRVTCEAGHWPADLYISLETMAKLQLLPVIPGSSPKASLASTCEDFEPS